MDTKKGVSGYDIAQFICLLVGFWFGLLPLGQRVFNAEQSHLHGWVFGQFHLADPFTFLLPLVIVLVMFGTIVGLEFRKKRARI